MEANHKNNINNNLDYNINQINNNNLNNINNNQINNSYTIIFENDILIQLLNKYFNKNSKVYYKYKYIYARQTKYIGEFIETITNDGMETKNSTKSITDYIVKNTTIAKEQYILSSEDFNNRYELVDNQDSIDNNNQSEWSLYKPRSTSQIKAIKINRKILIYLINQYKQNQLNQPNKINIILKFINNLKLKRSLKHYRFYLVAQWGENMIFKKDDYLVIPVNLVPNVYRIANKEFNETYKILNNNSK